MPRPAHRANRTPAWQQRSGRGVHRGRPRPGPPASMPAEAKGQRPGVILCPAPAVWRGWPGKDGGEMRAGAPPAPADGELFALGKTLPQRSNPGDKKNCWYFPAFEKSCTYRLPAHSAPCRANSNTVPTAGSSAIWVHPPEARALSASTRQSLPAYESVFTPRVCQPKDTPASSLLYLLLWPITLTLSPQRPHPDSGNTVPTAGSSAI